MLEGGHAPEKLDLANQGWPPMKVDSLAACRPPRSAQGVLRASLHLPCRREHYSCPKMLYYFQILRPRAILPLDFGTNARGVLTIWSVFWGRETIKNNWFCIFFVDFGGSPAGTPSTLTQRSAPQTPSGRFFLKV